MLGLFPAPLPALPREHRPHCAGRVLGSHRPFEALLLDQETAESYSLALPVSPRGFFGPYSPHGESADRLALEIGYYDEDLPKLIVDIVAFAETLGWLLSSPMMI